MNEILELLRMIKNPEQYVRNYAKQNPSPVMDNLIKMAESNDRQGIENFANNVFNEKGQNFEQIKSMLK